MKLSVVSACLIATGLLAGVPAMAQTSPGSSNPGGTGAQKQQTEGEGTTVVGPGSGAFKEYSDPKGWDADSRAWHKQHTSGTDVLNSPNGLPTQVDQQVAGSAVPAVKPR
jgi:hypothetical protein